MLERFIWMTEAPGSSPHKHIGVLLAEDSATVRWHLADIIRESPHLYVIGEAHNGLEVLEQVPRLQPKVISMDINMPRMDGFEATRRVMAQFPTPVVVVSNLIEKDIDLSFHALQAGALAVVEKPPHRGSPLFKEKQHHLLRTLTAMADVHVIRRGNTGRLGGIDLAPQPQAYTDVGPSPELIAIGASAGGPSALSKLLTALPREIALPLVIVQHMPQEFISGMARWLNKTTNWPVTIASQGMVLQPGMVHLSPGAAHLAVERRGGALIAALIDEQGPYRYQPSINVLFESVAQVCKSAAIGVILTGMGNDGVDGLLAMREAGAFTFAQDQASSTVFGMPNAAIERGAVQKILSLSDLPAAMINLL